MSQHIDPTPKQTDFDALKGKLKSLKMLSPSTDGNGGITTTLNASDCIILCVMCNVSYARINVAGVYDGKWVLQATELTTGAIRKNFNVRDITIYYYEL